MWYPAAPGAAHLDRPTAFLSRNWDDDFYALSGPGEVYDTPRVYNHQRERLGLGDHVCGTDEDFAQGAEYDPQAPPIEYDADGIPLCCDRVDVVGSALLGGPVTDSLYCASYRIICGAVNVLVNLNPPGLVDQFWFGLDAAGKLWELQSPRVTGIAGRWNVRYRPGGLPTFVIFLNGTSWNGRGTSPNFINFPADARAPAPTLTVQCADLPYYVPGGG